MSVWTWNARSCGVDPRFIRNASGRHFTLLVAEMGFILHRVDDNPVEQFKHRSVDRLLDTGAVALSSLRQSLKVLLSEAVAESRQATLNCASPGRYVTTCAAAAFRSASSDAALANATFRLCEFCA